MVENQGYNALFNATLHRLKMLIKKEEEEEVK